MVTQTAIATVADRSSRPEGAAVRGKPFDMTWNQFDHPLPPLARIDHILTATVAVRGPTGGQ